MIRILLVEDHRLLRDALVARFEREQGISIVGTAADAGEAIAQTARLMPDVVLLDVTLRGPSGLMVARELLRQWPRVRVLFLTMHGDLATMAQAFTAGAHGYVLKDQPFSDLRAAVDAVLGGRQVLPPGVTHAMIAAESRRRSRGPDADGPLGVLSAREREIFTLLAEGMNNADIAAHLGISVHTVDTHRARVLKKMHLHSLGDLVRLAARSGVLANPQRSVG